uniref:Uncharacterized protein n=1 Tax=Rhizophora mucronata TaxID=61149 RepID=A0A2P2QB40_RHIMU
MESIQAPNEKTSKSEIHAFQLFFEYLSTTIH